MNKKYYVPEIEEFHVGFQYEQVNHPWEINKPETKKWEKFKYNGNINSIGGFIQINTNEIRVKYLDKEDIENLGFKYVVDSYNGYFTDGRVDLAWLWNKKGIEITEVTKSAFGGKTLFLGIVKNKSELRRILKQIKTTKEII